MTDDFPVAITKFLEKHLRKEGLLLARCWRIESTVARKAWQRELEATGHIASAVGEQIQETLLLGQLSLFGFCPGLQATDDTIHIQPGPSLLN